jgi:hypothetical protein
MRAFWFMASISSSVSLGIGAELRIKLYIIKFIKLYI